MKEINQEEVFASFRDFLKSKGIELQEGTYTQRIRQGCEIVTDSVNLSQRALRETKSAVDRGLDHLRQVIHEQTAPKPAAEPAPAPPAAPHATPAGSDRKKAKPTPARARTGKRPRKS